jgi:hypothetical protein
MIISNKIKYYKKKNRNKYKKKIKIYNNNLIFLLMKILLFNKIYSYKVKASHNNKNSFLLFNQMNEKYY